MKPITIVVIICGLFFLFAGCNSTNLDVVSTKKNNGFLVEILTESSWEYTQSTYYQVSMDNKIVVDSTFVEPISGANNVQIKIVDNLFFGIEETRPNVVLFIHRMKDNASWPNSNKWADDLLSELRIETNNSEMQLSTHVQ